MKGFLGKVFLLLLVTALLLSLTGCKSADYKDAREAFTTADYARAEALLVALGDYRDSAQLLLKCRYAHANVLLEQGEFADAAVLLELLGDYEDSRQRFCEATYALALEALETKDFDAAQTYFTKLGGYKDAGSYLACMNAYRLAAFLQEKGPQRYESVDPEYCVTLSVADENIFLLEYLSEYENDFSTFHMYYAARFPVGCAEAYLYCESRFHHLGGVLEDRGSCTWDISCYKMGDAVVWDTYQVGGHKYDGSELETDALGLCAEPETELERMTAGLALLLYLCEEESGVALTMPEMGFLSMN